MGVRPRVTHGRLTSHAIGILRACTELGIQTTAIYSWEDRLSIHRYKADRAYRTGEPGRRMEVYLDGESIVAPAPAPITFPARQDRGTKALLAIGEVEGDGTRRVYFELNGQPRDIAVQGRSAELVVRIQEGEK